MSMASKRQPKFLPAELVSSLDEIYAEAAKPSDRRPIFAYGRATSPRVIACWQLASVGALVKRRQLRWGVPNPLYAIPKKSLFNASVYGEEPEHV